MWRERLGQDDLEVLTLAVEVAIAMRLDGHAADARELILSTLRAAGEHEVRSTRSPCCATHLRGRPAQPGVSSTRRWSST